MNDTDINEPVTIDHSSQQVLPTPKGIKLNSIDSVRVEMASVYRSMKVGSIETADGTKLVYVLGAIGKMIEIHDIEKRLASLERSNHGNT